MRKFVRCDSLLMAISQIGVSTHSQIMARNEGSRHSHRDPYKHLKHLVFKLNASPSPQSLWRRRDAHDIESTCIDWRDGPVAQWIEQQF